MPNRISLLAAASVLAITMGLPAAAIAQAAPFTKGFRYDAAQRIVGEILPDPDGPGPAGFPAVRNTFDDKGNLATVERGVLAVWPAESLAPAAWQGFTVSETIEYRFDLMGRAIRETRKAGGGVVALAQTSFDVLGRRQCQAVRMNLGLATLPDACIQSTAGASGPDRITRYEYDARGRPIQIRTGVGTSLERAERTLAYAGGGNIATLVDARGNRTTYEYDGLARLSRVRHPSTAPAPGFNPASAATALATAGASSTTDYMAFGYDLNGNRVSTRSRNGAVIGFSYDARNQVIQKDLPPGGGQDVFFGYDLAGNRTFARYGSVSGPGITVTYDGVGRPVATSDTTHGSALALSRAFDRDGNRTRLVHPDGAGFDYGFDGGNRLASLALPGGQGALTFSHDGQGRRNGLAYGQGVTTSLSLDGVSRVTGMTHAWPQGGVTFGLAYSPASQVVTRTATSPLFNHAGGQGTVGYVANTLNQYATIGGVGRTWDANGNLSSDGGSTYAYDAENRLVSISGARTASLSYDPLGRLSRIVTPSGDERLFYDGDDLVAVYSASGALIERYVHGDRADEPLVRYSGSSLTAPRPLLADERGSIIGEFSGALQAFAYDEHGNRPAGQASRFGFNGQLWLEAIGKYYYKARIYDPAMGRFLQVDPAGVADQVNLYAYVRNDPVNNSDPGGLATCGKSLSLGTCRLVMDAQGNALSATRAAIADLRNLRQERANVASGSASGLSERALATEASLKANFDSTTNATLGRVESRLESVANFLSDTSGRFTYEAGSAADVRRAGGDPAKVPAYAMRAGDNKVYVMNSFSTFSPDDQVQTLVHEPAHLDGANYRPDQSETYGRVQAQALARSPGGTRRALNNADNYAVFVH